MNLQKYEKLRDKFEVLSFENNYNIINKILYYFSYLGNVFLILFSYFFLKTVTDTIPNLFVGQSMFFMIFIILFMAGYELFKRFAIEQLFQSWFIIKRATASIIMGGLICATLAIGSFYLSIKGSHRLIDGTKELTSTSDSLVAIKSSLLQVERSKTMESLSKQLDGVTALINKTVDAASAQSRTLTRAEQSNITRWEFQVVSLKKEVAASDSIYNINSTQLTGKSYISNIDSTQSEENNLAFVLLTFFLEILIVVGVGFNSYYKVSTYNEMKAIMRTEAYQKLLNNMALLQLYYSNGVKRVGDQCTSINKFTSLVKLRGIGVHIREITDFIILLNELQVTQTKSRRNRVFVMDYELAKKIIQDQKIKL